MTRDELDAFLASDYARVVLAVAVITGDRVGAEDAVQDALVGYLTNPPRREVNNVAGWITVVAANRVRARYRSSAAERRAVDMLTSALADRVEPDPATRGLDPEVSAALAALPERQRQVCVLHYLFDQPVEAVAEALGVATGTVKVQLHRGRKTLAARLGKERHG